MPSKVGVNIIDLWPIVNLIIFFFKIKLCAPSPGLLTLLNPYFSVTIHSFLVLQDNFQIVHGNLFLRCTGQLTFKLLSHISHLSVQRPFSNGSDLQNILFKLLTAFSTTLIFKPTCLNTLSIAFFNWLLGVESKNITDSQPPSLYHASSFL